jgi:D-3-phosphoglycerate dehydrogenase
VLEFEKPSFENIEIVNEDLQYLLDSEKVIVTPHIAGWTTQSKEKLAQVIVDKILAGFSKD